MKTKNSSSKPIDNTPGQIRYCNLYLEFPDGEVWSNYTHIAGGFNAWLRNVGRWITKQPGVLRNLEVKGEAHWDQRLPIDGHMLIVKYRIKISEVPCEVKWGLNKNVHQKSAIEVVR